MRIEIKALAWASAIVTAAVYTLCALAIAVSPQGFMAALGYTVHADLAALARPITWGAFATGLVAWTVGDALVAAGLGWVYNRFAAPAAPAARVQMLRSEEKARR